MLQRGYLIQFSLADSFILSNILFQQNWKIIWPLKLNRDYFLGSMKDSVFSNLFLPQKKHKISSDKAHFLAPYHGLLYYVGRPPLISNKKILHAGGLLNLKKYADGSTKTSKTVLLVVVLFVEVVLADFVFVVIVFVVVVFAAMNSKH